MMNEQIKQQKAAGSHSHSGYASTATATTAANGLMSADDKQKIDKTTAVKCGAGEVDASATGFIYQSGGLNFKVEKYNGTPGLYIITHNMNTMNYAVTVTPRVTDNKVKNVHAMVGDRDYLRFIIGIYDSNGTPIAYRFNFIVMGQ